MYKTISKSDEILFKEKASKFYGYTAHINSTKEVDQVLNEIRKTHASCKHICYAYRLLDNQNIIEYMNDAGEPSNTAGAPILGQIKSFNLLNTLVIVPRYFGGVKLGTGGLISAYKEAAKLAIKNSIIQTSQITEIAHIQFNYDQTSDVEYIIRNHDIQILNQSFKENCSFELKVPVKNKTEIYREFQAKKILIEHQKT